jgi:hypothetical protein
VSMNVLYSLGVFPSCTPLMLSLHIDGVLGFAHRKEQAKNLPK